MWDSREPSLNNQFIDATEFHGQAGTPDSIAHPDDSALGAAFQEGTFSAQVADFTAGDLTGADGSGALGGPENLFNSRLNLPAGGFSPGSCFASGPLDGFNGVIESVIEPFFCPGGLIGPPPAFVTIDLFSAFANATTGKASLVAKRQSIARGEVIFNKRSFNVTDVDGLDDVLNGTVGGSSAAGEPNAPGGSASTVSGTCSTCHNNVNVADDDFGDPKREGIMDNSNNTHGALAPSSDFPLFAFYCPLNSISFFSNPVSSTYCAMLPGSPSMCDEFDTTDPGQGLADGECDDLGKMKVPVLHNLAVRAPYFHGGNVADLPTLVNFYNTRFQIGLSAQDKTDLVNFLSSL